MENALTPIIGNPPYVQYRAACTRFFPSSEVEIYKKKYKTSYKQFDKYFIFVEQAIRKTKDAGYVCYIVPNKFFQRLAQENICET